MRSAEELTDTIEATFTTIQHTRMDGVPVMNTALSVRLLGLRSWDGFWLGTLLTPWFMNLILLPETPDDTPLASGTKRTFRFPAGSFEFIRGEEAGIGGYWMCSLFSPVFEFEDHETAEACGLSALEELFVAAETPSASEAGMTAVWRGDLSEAVEFAENAELEEVDVAGDTAASAESDTPPCDVQTGGAGFSRRGLLTGNLASEVHHEP